MAVFKGSSVRYYDSTNQKFVRIQGSQATGSDYTLQLPPNVGSADQVLKLPSAISDTNQLVWGDAGGSSSQTVTTLAPQGTTDSTTAVAVYGINVIEASDASNVALRLPLAETGKSLTITNKTAFALRVFPSATGGSINGVVDKAVFIGTNQPCTFFCIENPLPGAWTVSLPATGQIESAQIDVVKGAAGSGGVTAFNSGLPGVTSTTSVTSGISSGSLLLTGPFNTLTSTNATITKLKVYTNILASDLQPTAGGRSVTVRLTQAYQVDASGANLGSRMSHLFFANDWNEVSGGLSYTGEVGDNGTLYYELEPNPIQQPEYFIIGNNFQNGATGIVSNGYYTFGIEIETNVPAKTYKFKFFLEHT